MGHVPPGWPPEIRPPGATDWESQAGNYLLDCCAPDLRRYPVLRRHPLALVSVVELHVRGQRRAAADAVGLIRAELDGRVEPEVVTAAIEVWQSERARLARVEREVGLLRRAFLGEQFVPKLG